MLAEKIKHLADQMLDKRATVGSVASHIGPWKNEDGSSECELTPQDREFVSGDIGIASSDAHLPVAARGIDYLDLTLAKDASLTVHALAEVFGKWRAATPPPSGNPYGVTFYYPNDKALLSVSVQATLSGPADETATHVVSFTLHRNDFTGTKATR